jgi:hypothetical protein
MHRTAIKAQLQCLQANACGVDIRAELITLHLDCITEVLLRLLTL